VATAPLIARDDATGQYQPGQCRVEVATSVDRLPAHWPRSTDPGAAQVHPFQCADVLAVWCDTIGRARGIEPLFVSVLAPSGRPLMLLPLGIRTQYGTKVLRFLDGGVSDYNAPALYAGANFSGNADALWAEIARHLPRFDIAILEKMPAAVGGLSNPLFALTTDEHHESCHAVSLYGPWETFARDKISNAADSRRRRRKLDKLGTVRIAIAESANEREHFLDAMMRMKRHKFIET
jgi:CelD/BcsL family acetyltransferase involved in cellulose biosynthesis